MIAERVLILEAAALDIEQGRSFYEIQLEGLGDYFLDSILSDIQSLRISAGVHAVWNGHHRVLSNRFPFAIYYDYDGTEASVVAVLHMRGHPTWARNRLDGD